MPVYKATEKASNKVRLIDAGTRQQVNNHLLGDTYIVESTTTSEMLALQKSGIDVETFGSEPKTAGGDVE